MRKALIVLCVALVALTACSKKSSFSGTTPSSSAGSDPVIVTGPAGQKPTIQIVSATPPTTLYTKDIIEGTGATAAVGQQVTVQYVGVSYSTKKQFDASWDRGQAFPFGLGQGQVIKGWDQGVVGMKVGGRRLLVIPPDLGYGAAGAGSAIGPNETLVFVVDLVKVG